MTGGVGARWRAGGIASTGREDGGIGGKVELDDGRSYEEKRRMREVKCTGSESGRFGTR